MYVCSRETHLRLTIESLSPSQSTSNATAHTHTHRQAEQDGIGPGTAPPLQSPYIPKYIQIRLHTTRAHTNARCNMVPPWLMQPHPETVVGAGRIDKKERGRRQKRQERGKER